MELNNLKIYNAPKVEVAEMSVENAMLGTSPSIDINGGHYESEDVWD